MIFGMQAGRLLRRDLDLPAKLGRLVAAGLAGVAVGLAIDGAGLCPIVKRIWTPSWAIFSGGAAALMLAGFVGVIEWAGRRRWAFPLIVVGMNPIAIYCLWQLMSGFIRENVRRHLGRDIYETFGAAYAPGLERASVLLVLWLILLWMYRRKLFLRV